MTSDRLRTQTHSAIGANIKGTPSMKASKVSADLRVLRKKCSILVVQEFKWGWYWRVLGRLLLRAKSKKNRWGSSPSGRTALGNPVLGAQGVLWLQGEWKKISTRKRLLMKKGPYSDNRYLRGVLVEDRETGIRGWFCSAHFVVSGDRKGDGSGRKAMLRRNIESLSAFLTMLESTGHPIWFEMDANIAKDSEAYPILMNMLRDHKAKVHGGHGVEYMFTIRGKRTEFKVKKTWAVMTKAQGGVLNTDHEARGCDFVLQEIA